MYMSKSSDPYKYAVMTSINCKDKCFFIARDIRYQKVIPFIIGEYVSSKSMLGLCVNPCVTNLALYLTTTVFSFCFQIKTHLNLTRWIRGGVGITLLNTCLFLNELSSALITSFHLIQFERSLHSNMVSRSGSLRRLATMVEKHELPTVVLQPNNSQELV
jgi:hypothetical protein